MFNAVNAKDATLAAVNTKITDTQTALSIATGSQRAELEQTLILLKFIKKGYEEYGSSLDLIVGTISRLTGIDNTSIADIFSNNDSDLITSKYAMVFDDVTNSTVRVAKSLKAMGMVLIPLTDGTYSFRDMTADQIQYIGTSASLVNTLTSVEEGFASGSITVDEMSAKLFGAKSAYDELAKSAADTDNNLRVQKQLTEDVTRAQAEGPAAVAAAIERLAEYNIAVAESTIQMAAADTQLKEYQASLAKFKIATNILSTVQSTFSGQTGEVDKANMSGLVSLSGQLAKNSDEQKINQTEILGSIIAQDEKIQKTVPHLAGIALLNGEQLAIQQASVAAKKAFAGQLIQEYQETLKLLQAEQKRTIELQNQLAILKQQGKINTMAATFKLQATYTQNSLSSQERGIQLDQTRLDNLTVENQQGLQRIKNSNEVANIEADIANIKGSGNAAQDAAALQAIKNQTKLNAAARELIEMDRDVSTTRAELEDKKRANLELEKQVMIDNYNMQKKAIEASGGGNAAVTKAQIDALELQKNELRTEFAMLTNAKNGENKQRLAIFDKETKLMDAKITADIKKLENDQLILEETRKLDRARLDAQVIASANDNEILKNQLKGYQSFATSINGMLDATRTFATAIAELLGYLPGGNSAAIEKSISELPQNQVDNLTELEGAINSNIDAQNRLYEKQYAGMDAVAAIEDRNYRAQIQGLKDQLKDVVTLRGEQRTALKAQQFAAAQDILHKIKMIGLQQTQAELEGKAGGSNTAAQLAQLKAQLQQDLADIGYSMADLGFESNTLLQALLAVKETLRSSVTQALVDLNASFFDTTNDIRTFGEKIQDAFYNIFKSIQETFFQKAIAEPIANFVTDAVSGLFGGGKETKGADNAKVIDGALLTTTAQSAGENPILTVAKEGNGFFARVFDSIKNTFSGIFGQGGFISNLIGGVFGQDGVFAGALRSLGGIGKGIFSSLGGIISNILSSIGSGGGGIIGSIASGIGSLFASGGTVHNMAQGGGVNSLRDRIPAMLEPGEFVLRKQAASAIGVPALQAMNAGGAVGGNVVVNIKNEGTPQDATASKPRFDGEKFVIDIITRDLSNNGPIRRSMRAGS